MELTHKDYKRINNLHNEGLPGFATGSIPGVAPGIAGASSPSKLYLQPQGYKSPQFSGVDLSTLPKTGTYDIAGRSQALTVPKDANVLPEGKPLSTQNPNGNFMDKTNGVQSAGFGFALGGWLGGGAVLGIDRIYNQYDNDTLLGEAGSSTANIGGISFNRLNIVDYDDIVKRYDKEVRMDSWTNPASFIAGVIGRGRVHDQAKFAQAKSIELANSQTGNALTKSMRLNYNKEHGDPSQQYLYGAKDGKLPKFKEGVVSAFGKINTDPTAMVSNGEVMEQNGVMTRVGRGKDSKDTLPAYADGSTTIYPNKGKDRFGIDISDYVWKTGDTNGGLYMLQQYQADKLNNNLFYAKCGKLPKYEEGAWANNIISGIGMLSGLGLSLHAALNKPHRPKSYIENPYELESLSTLAGLDINPYPIIQQMRNAETRTNRAIDRSGGLSTAQRNLSRLSALYGTLNNIANTLASIQQQRNQYKTNYAQAALNAGNASRQARMSANQFDLDYYSKAHAAQLAGMQTGVQNMLAQAQGWYRNDFKRRQFNDTMGLYRAQQAQDLSALQAQSNQFMQQMALANKQLDLQKQLNSYLDILNDRAKFMEAMELAKKKGWIPA